MVQVPAPRVEQPNGERCSRCLQPLPPRRRRCPGCGHLAPSRRALPLTIGIVGVCALVFFMLVMYQVVTDEDLAKAPTLVDEGAQSQEQVLRDAASTEGQSK